MLEPIPDLVFDARAHRYSYKGEWLAHSISSVAQPLTAEEKERIWAYKDGPDGWEIRGNTIHEALERHLIGKGVVAEDKWWEWLGPLLDDPLWQGCEILAVEHSVCSASKSLGGSFDALIRSEKGSTFLIDLKTTDSANKAKKRKPATAQLGGYLACLVDHYPELTVDRCLTVVSAPGEVVIKTDMPDECLAAWSDAWTKHEAKQMLLGF